LIPRRQGYNARVTGDTASSILRRVIDPKSGDLTHTAAETFLRLAFSEADHERVQELAERHTEGSLTPEERQEYEGYVVVGEFLAVMQAKARASIHNRPSAA
jgi:hypothetical protein